jgi:hypothetical protein
LVPSFDGGDDLVGIGGPCEGLGVFVGLGDEAIDGGLQVDEGVKDTALEASFGGLIQTSEFVSKPRIFISYVRPVPIRLTQTPPTSSVALLPA